MISIGAFQWVFGLSLLNQWPHICSFPNSYSFHTSPKRVNYVANSRFCPIYTQRGRFHSAHFRRHANTRSFNVFVMSAGPMLTSQPSWPFLESVSWRANHFWTKAPCCRKPNRRAFPTSAHATSVPRARLLAMESRSGLVFGGRSHLLTAGLEIHKLSSSDHSFPLQPRRLTPLPNSPRSANRTDISFAMWLETDVAVIAALLLAHQVTPDFAALTDEEPGPKVESTPADLHMRAKKCGVKVLYSALPKRPAMHI